MRMLRAASVFAAVSTLAVAVLSGVPAQGSHGSAAVCDLLNRQQVPGGDLRRRGDGTPHPMRPGTHRRPAGRHNGTGRSRLRRRRPGQRPLHGHVDAHHSERDHGGLGQRGDPGWLQRQPRVAGERHGLRKVHERRCVLDGHGPADDALGVVDQVFGDPTLASDRVRGQGTAPFYFSNLAELANNTSIISVHKTLDGGLTWTQAANATPGALAADFQDKSWMAVDTRASGTGAGNVTCAGPGPSAPVGSRSASHGRSMVARRSRSSRPTCRPTPT